MKTILNTLYIFLVLNLFGLANANEAVTEKSSASADQIVEASNLAAYYAGGDGKSMARLTIVDSNSREQQRIFTILRKDIADGGDQLFLVVFSRPADIKGTSFLVHKHPQTEDDRWLYLPALDLVKRISAGDKRTSFVGSHYFYEDVSGRSPLADTHEVIDETERQWVLKHTPKSSDGVEFTSYTTWIDKSNYLPVRIEYHDASGKVYRRIESLSVEDIQGHPTVTKARVSNLSDGSYTLLEFRNTKYDLGIGDDVFVERALRNPPLEWISK